MPATFTEKDELVWTLTANGKTEKAWASLRVDYKLDDVVKASETGALGAGTQQPGDPREQAACRATCSARRRSAPRSASR